MFLPLDSGQRGKEAGKWSDTNQQTTRGKGINYIVEGTWTFSCSIPRLRTSAPTMACNLEMAKSSLTG